MRTMEEPRILESALCLHLRSKKTYSLHAPPASREDVLDGSGHCWCKRTMMALGPDEERVDPDTCRAGRSCFETIR
jgi:hypothetical protein